MTECRCAHRWSFLKWGGNLEHLVDELPAPTGREVTVRVIAAGVCHSDLHIREGGFDMGGGTMSSMANSVKLPVTMGHEVAGEIVEIGPDVTDVRIGEKVVVFPWLGCGVCDVCLRGDDNICPNGFNTIGVSVPGGYSSLVRVPDSKFVVPFETLDPAQAATLACAGITSYSAVRKVGNLGERDFVAIIGCGGVGMTAVAIHKMIGKARLIAVDPDPSKRKAALEFGAEKAFDPADPNCLSEILAYAGRNVAAAIDFVGAESTSSMAIKLVRRGGQVVIVGLFGGELRVPLPTIPMHPLQITGSYVGTLRDLKELVELAETRKLPEIPFDRRSLSDVNQALDDLHHGRVLGRLILSPSPSEVNADAGT